MRYHNGKEGTDVADMMQLLFELSGSVREMMALVMVMKRTRANTLLQSWIDGQEVMDTLKISKRTLQSMRTSGVLPYSRLNGKIYYKVSDLEHILNENYNYSLNQNQV